MWISRRELQRLRNKCFAQANTIVGLQNAIRQLDQTVERYGEERRKMSGEIYELKLRIEELEGGDSHDI